MSFTNEQLAKMNAAKTAEELIALAKAEGIEATEEEIKAQFEALHKEGELADEELDNVSGGGADCFPVNIPTNTGSTPAEMECKFFEKSSSCSSDKEECGNCCHFCSTPNGDYDGLCGRSSKLE